MSLLPAALSPLPSMLTWQLPSLSSKTRLRLPALAPSLPPSRLRAFLLVPYPFLPPLLATRPLLVAPSPWIWTVPEVSRVHLPWRSFVVVLTLVSAPIVASLVTRWPPARWPLALARLGVPTNTSPSFPARIRLLQLLQLLLPPLLLLQLLLHTRPVTRHSGTLQSGTLQSGTLQPGFHQQLFPT